MQNKTSSRVQPGNDVWKRLRMPSMLSFPHALLNTFSQPVKSGFTTWAVCSVVLQSDLIPPWLSFCRLWLFQQGYQQSGPEGVHFKFNQLVPEAEKKRTIDRNKDNYGHYPTRFAGVCIRGERGRERGRTESWMADCHAVESEKGRAGIVMRMYSDREWG